MIKAMRRKGFLQLFPPHIFPENAARVETAKPKRLRSSAKPSPAEQIDKLRLGERHKLLAKAFIDFLIAILGCTLSTLSFRACTLTRILKGNSSDFAYDDVPVVALS
mmetsp:Transcript_20532/g.46391  ORF Transcript_20532/g.46391 Transcript_20532/m.46391 type:complete len:107 (-) Transcript_20532:172-492(-)